MFAFSWSKKGSSEGKWGAMEKQVNHCFNSSGMKVFMFKDLRNPRRNCLSQTEPGNFSFLHAVDNSLAFQYNEAIRRADYFL